MIGYLFAIMPWAHFFDNMQVNDVDEIKIQVTSTCGTDFRVVVQDDEATAVSANQWDSSYDHVSFSRPLADLVPNNCNYTITTYATPALADEWIVSMVGFCYILASSNQPSN